MAAKKSSKGRKPAVQRGQGHPSFDIPNPVDVAKSVGKYVGDVFSPSTYTKPSKAKRQRQIRATNTAANKVTEKVYSSVGGKQLLGDYWAPNVGGKIKAAAQTASWALPYGKAFKGIDKLVKTGPNAGRIVRAGAKTLRGGLKAGTVVAGNIKYEQGVKSIASRAEKLAERKKPKTGGTRRPATKKKGK